MQVGGGRRKRGRRRDSVEGRDEGEMDKVAEKGRGRDIRQISLCGRNRKEEGRTGNTKNGTGGTGKGTKYKEWNRWNRKYRE